MTDSNKNSGSLGPGEESPGTSNSEDRNGLRQIIDEQAPSGAGAPCCAPVNDGKNAEQVEGSASFASDCNNSTQNSALPDSGIAFETADEGASSDRAAPCAAVRSPDAGPSSLGAAPRSLGEAVAAGKAALGRKIWVRRKKMSRSAYRAEGQAEKRQADTLLKSQVHGRVPTQSSVPNPRWGSKALHRDSAQQEWRKHDVLPGGGNVPPCGAWVWLPEGVSQKESWRKRHPFLFWGGIVLAIVLLFSGGRFWESGLLTGPKIAVINVEGVILDSGQIVAFMEEVRRDSSYSGAVLRINSPGGAVGPSQEIYHAAKRLGAVKPLVASMGALAASGGYYAALGAETILAGPSTLTASIGVKMQIPNFEELMTTLGISEKTLTTGSLKDAGSSWREMSPDEEAYFRALLMDMYDEFIETVANERDMTLDEVRALADGRAMTGRQALEAGLVDDMGDIYEAVQRVKFQAGLSLVPVQLVEGPKKPGSYFSDVLKSAMRSVLGERAALEQPRFFY